MAIRATGAAELRHVAGLCRTAGVGFASDIIGSLMGAEPEIAAAMKANVTAVLPKSGGFNAWVADSRVRLTPKRAGLSAGVTVRVSRGSLIGPVPADLSGLDAGRAIHPTYGRSPWYGQSVAPLSISDPIREEGGDQLEQALLDRATHVTERIAHG